MMDVLTGMSPVMRFAGGIHAVHVAIAPFASMSGHRHRQPTLVGVLSGSIESRVNGRWVCSGQDAVELIPAGVTRSVRTAAAGAECLVVTADPAQPAGAHPVWNTRASIRVTAASTGAEWTRVRDAVLGRVLDGVTDIEIPERTLMEFLQAVTLRNAPRQTIPDWCANAVNQIESRVDVRYSRLGVARLAGVHPVHLTRSLRRYFGLTTRACLRRAGVARAATLLRTTNASIAQIAYDTGFSDHAHLTREFGRRMGLSPSAYRTSAGRGDVAFIQADRFPATDLGTLRVS